MSASIHGVVMLCAALLAFTAIPSAGAPSRAKPRKAASGPAKPGNAEVSPLDTSAAAAPPSDTTTPAAPAATASPASDTSAPPPRLLLDLVSVEAKAQEVHPILSEKRVNIDKAEEKLHELETAAILPKFSVETGVGPAPGLRTQLDTTSLHFSLHDTTYFVRQNQKEFDFTNWGPFYGIEVNAVQPLNISRYRAGKRASIAGVKVAEAEFQKERMDVSEESQKLYYQRVFAGQMASILRDAGKELDKAQKKMQDLLDEGDKDVKQTDLLELKAGRFTFEKARSEANLGVQRTDLGLRFLLQVPDSVQLATADTVLLLRQEVLPSLDSLKLLTLRDHPDLKRLSNGLAAREELLRVAKGEVGPDIFLFGNFKYTKAWSTDRESGGNDPFARDPLNEITGVGGLGMRLQLNFWQRYEKVRKERIELKQLRRTEAYAAKGLLIKMQDEYVQMLKARNDVNESQKSLRAAEAWLKAAAMKYDLDPSNAKDLISPFRTVLTAKRDYYQSVLDYNLAVSRVMKAIGWTLTDYFHNFVKSGK